jgi:hypothetical protein
MLLVLVVLLSVAAASPASAAPRKVPFGFVGTVAPPDLMNPSVTSDAVLDQQVGLMASSGVESLRLSLAWAQLEPQRGVFTLSILDRLIAATARHHVQALVNVAYTPRWNSPNTGTPEYWRYAPKDPGAFGDLMRVLVQRYGPGGSFFKQNPSLPRVPVREWQPWNEQDAPWYWRGASWPAGYTALLKSAYRAIHGVDHGARVVAGSLVASSANETPWGALGQMYRAGAHKYFDAISVHPFTFVKPNVRTSIDHLVVIVQRMRAAMRQHGDSHKPILLTEMTWSAAAGKVPKGALLGFETTPRGQAQRLAAAYAEAAKLRHSLRIVQVDWYSWGTNYDARGDLSDMIFRFSGLTRDAVGSFVRMPLLGTYASAAAKLEGCRKSSDASRCR